MKAMLFAAGLGTRLRPLTDHCPKALVRIDGLTPLDITLERLHRAGATEVVVNVHHFGEQIMEHLATRDYDMSVKISDERDMLLDTGGGLRKAAGLFRQDGEPILIHNVDILSNAPLSSFYEENRFRAAALLVSHRETSRYLLFDDTDRLVGWTNTKTGEVRTPFKNLDADKCRRYAFSGIHTFSPRLFPMMEPFPEKFSIIDFYLSVCDKVTVKGCPLAGLQLLDIGKPEALASATSFLEKIRNAND